MMRATQPPVEWELGVERPYPRNSSIPSLVLDQARRCPDSIAVVDGGVELTYADLVNRSAGLANRLSAAGVGRGDRVVLLLDRSSDAVTAMLATLWVGAAYVPLDPAYPADRKRWIVDDTGASVVLSSRGTPAVENERVQTLFVGDCEAGRGSEEPVEVDPLAPAYVIYTSGSTGTPKGVIVPHRAIVRLVVGTDYAHFGPDDVVAFASNVAFDAATFEVWGALLNGARLVVLNRETVLTPRLLAEALRDRGVTSLFLTTSVFNAASRERPDAFAGLKQVVFGGEAADAQSIRRVLSADPPQRLVNGYGPTEATTFTTAHLVNDLSPDATAVPIGRPIAHAEVRILGPDGQSVPIGEVGELYIGGDGLALGYLGRDDLTAARFVADPRDPSRRLYRSGDRASWRSDGVVEYHGRMDRQVKVRGHLVEPAEVESRLGQHPLVGACAIDVQATGNDARLVAFVVPRNGGTLSASELRAYLASHLPDALVPAQFEVVAALPLTPNGKLDRAALPRVRPSRSTSSETYQAPTSPIEGELVELWQDLLRVDPVGIDDSFFALGGHSLLAVRLFAAIEARYDTYLPLSTLLEAATVRTLAARIQLKEKPSFSHLVVIREGDPNVLPFFCVHGAGGNVLNFHDLGRRLGDDRAVYGLQARGVDGILEPHESIEAMADAYLAEISRVQSGGPYLLGGYSGGGLVAFEMAHQLLQKDEEVAALILLDTATPDIRVDVARPARERGERRLRGLLHDGRRYAATWARERAQFERWRMRELRLALPRNAARPLPTSLREVRLTRAFHAAAARYVPRPLNVPMVLFRAPDLPPGLEHVGSDLGWRPLALAGLDIRTASGTHDDIVREPHVAPLADTLTAVLRNSTGHLVPASTSAPFLS